MNSNSENLVYCLQLSGINCTNCEAKIKKALSNQEGIKKVSVNILQEKVSVVV